MSDHREHCCTNCGSLTCNARTCYRALEEQRDAMREAYAEAHEWAVNANAALLATARQRDAMRVALEEIRQEIGYGLIENQGEESKQKYFRRASGIARAALDSKEQQQDEC